MASFCAIVQDHYKRWTGARNSTDQVTNTCLKGVLVAISIPIFTSQLEKAREATDAANIRAAYAEVQTAALTEENTDSKTGVTRSGASGSYTWTKTVNLVQKQDKWQSCVPNIGGVTIKTDDVKAEGTATITYTESTGNTTIAFAPKS